MEIIVAIIVARHKVGEPKLVSELLKGPITGVNVKPLELFHGRLRARLLDTMLHGSHELRGYFLALTVRK